MKKLLNIILTLLILCNVAFIWGNSAIDAKGSNDLSISVVETGDKVLGIDREEPVETSHSVVKNIRKLAHVIEFMSLGVLLALLFRGLGRMPAAAFLSGAFVGMTDEHIQKYTGRTSAFSDVCLDAYGVFTGVLLVCVVLYLIGKIRKLRRV